jgi:hypothetical protein
VRGRITDWQKLTSIEQGALATVLGSEAESIFNDSVIQEGRDTLLNMLYLMTSWKVAGNLWRHVSALCWAGSNQLGIEVFDPEQFRLELVASANFKADGRLTCYLKRSRWSLRQVRVAGRQITEHGFQIYRPSMPARLRLLVADIDTIVFSRLRAWPRHAIDILRPDPVLNDPLRARRALVARGIFPEPGLV